MRIPVGIVYFGLLAYLPAHAHMSEYKVESVAAASDCAKIEWHARGKAPKSFVIGMGLSYEKTYCDMQSDPNSVAFAVANNDFPAKYDALASYGRIDSSTPQERLRDTYALLIGEGMRESSGNPTAGYDITNKNLSASTAESGLFQISYDSLRFSPILEKIYAHFRQDKSACLTSTFQKNIKNKRAKIIGSGKPAGFQRLMKSCPAFAVEYGSALLRINLKHFGPIVRKEATIEPACSAMLEKIESVSDCISKKEN